MSGTAAVSTQFAAATSATGAQLDGNFSTIVAYINDPTNRNNYAADTGGTNTVALTFSPPVVGGYTTGLEITFKAAFANSGAVVVNANSLGNKSLVNNDGSALVAGQMIAGSQCKAVYDGTQFIFINGPAPATQAAMETATAVATFVSPAAMKWHPGVAKASALWSGTATGTIALNGGHNVSSVVKGGTGTYTINFTAPFSSANIVGVGTLEVPGAGVGFAVLKSRSTAAVTVATYNTTGAAAEGDFVHYAFFGDLP